MMPDMDSGCIYTLNFNLSKILDIVVATMSRIFTFGVERIQEQIPVTVRHSAMFVRDYEHMTTTIARAFKRLTAKRIYWQKWVETIRVQNSRRMRMV